MTSATAEPSPPSPANPTPGESPKSAVVVAPSAPVDKPVKQPFHRRHRKKLIALAVLLLFPIFLHFTIVLTTRITPPQLGAAPAGQVEERGDVRWFNQSYATQRGKIQEVRLVGDPEQIGHAMAKLLYSQMVQGERQLFTMFETLVPIAPLRWMIMDFARVLHRGADRQMSPDRLREIAAEARAFSPDPFQDRFPTFQRLVYLNSLYDIALGFEHSPMLGCTSFAATGPATVGGHTILARNFDFEAGPAFDDGKVVYLVFEEGKIPFASVAWPGLVGVFSGMNQKGLSVVIHGGRARDTRAEGEPVVHTTRALLSEASTVEEAVAMLEKRQPMVSHILMLADASGKSAIVERAPGEKPFVRWNEGPIFPLTNHFEGPFASDPKNISVRQHTSTLPRRERLDELLAEGKPIDASRAIEILRDKHGVGGKDLPLGTRSTLDAVIATHSVVMDSTDLVIWVSEGPHLMGRYVAFDLKKLLDLSYDPSSSPTPLVTLPADPAYVDGSYQKWVDAGSPHQGAM
ncbi:MAG: C45 family peptidase [Polyangiaceae bacterium]